MKINFVKINFNQTESYKYKPIKYCCPGIMRYPIVIANEDLRDQNYGYYGTDDMPRVCISETIHRQDWDDEWDETENHVINYCPYCGEKIVLAVVDEKDCDELYQEVTNLRKKKWAEYIKTDSKKKANKLRQEVAELDNKINGLYELEEYKE